MYLSLRYFHNTFLLPKAIFSYHFGLSLFFWGGFLGEESGDQGVLGVFIGVLGFLVSVWVMVFLVFWSFYCFS